jgi:adenosylhomocysteine nucleosidase
LKPSPIVVTFARPEESRAFRRRLTGKQRTRVGSLKALAGRFGSAEVVCVHTGIGGESATRVAREVLDRHKGAIWIGAGFAGALAPGLGAGDVVMEDHFEKEGGPRRIISRDLPVETVEEKAALFRATGAQAVDMETEALAAVCAGGGTSLMAVRAVSDTAQESLPVPFRVWFDPERQRARVVSLLGWLACHPGRLAPFARFVRRLPKVAEALAFSIEGVIGGVMNH